MKSSEKRSFKQYPFSHSDLKAALGGFGTGITIVTTKNSRNKNIGITVNSFSSVSLDPPLVLWSIAKSAKCFQDSFSKYIAESKIFLTQTISQSTSSERIKKSYPINLLPGMWTNFMDWHVLRGLREYPYYPSIVSVFNAN